MGHKESNQTNKYKVERIDQESIQSSKNYNTVKSHKFKVLRIQEVLFHSIKSFNYREVDMKIYITPKTDYYQCFPIKHMFLFSVNIHL